MKGSILAVDFQANEAVITGDDGTRYKFANSEWKSPEAPARGQRVDFVVADGRAVEVYIETAGQGGESGPRLEGTTLGSSGVVSPGPPSVASRICWKSADGAGSLARVGYAIRSSDLGTARAATRPAIA